MPAHYVVNFKIDRALTETRWISASVTSFSPRHDKVALSIISYSLCHREGEARGDPLGAGKRMALSEHVDCMQWIAASVTCVLSSQ